MSDYSNTGHTPGSWQAKLETLTYPTCGTFHFAAHEDALQRRLGIFGDIDKLTELATLMTSQGYRRVYTTQRRWAYIPPESTPAFWDQHGPYNEYGYVWQLEKHAPEFGRSR